MLRLREGYGTDGGEVVRLQGWSAATARSGADGMVLGFLNAHTEVDVAVVAEMVGDEPEFGWTFPGRSTPASPPTGPGASCAGCPGWTRC